MHLTEASKVLRLSYEEIVELLSKGEMSGRPPRPLSTSHGYDYCTGWLIERRSVEKYLAAHGRGRRKAQRLGTDVPAVILTNASSNAPQISTGF